MAELNELHDQLQQIMIKLQDIEDNIEQKLCGDQTTNSNVDSNQFETTENPEENEYFESEETDDENPEENECFESEETDDENPGENGHFESEEPDDEKTEDENLGYGNDMGDGHSLEMECEHDYENDNDSWID